MSNKKAIENAIRDFFNRDVYDLVEVELSKAAIRLVSFIESSGAIPFDTGNLQDSTGVGVYVGGRLKKYVPVKSATKPKSGDYSKLKGHSGSKGVDIWGTDRLSEAIDMASTDYASGVWLVVFSTMPYAYKVDETNDYFLSGDVYEEVKKVIFG